MNKQGQTGAILVFLTLGLILGALLFASSNTEYDSYMRDCKRLYKDDFKMNKTFDERNWLEIFNNTEPRYYVAEGTDKEKLEKYCLSKYSPKDDLQEQEKWKKKELLKL